MRTTIEECIAESFCLRYGEIQRSVLGNAQRFGQRISRGLAACGAARRLEARESILKDGAQLGLEHFLLRNDADDETVDPLLLVLLVEELGAADLESALDLLLPVGVAWLADAAESCFLEKELRTKLLSGHMSVALMAAELGSDGGGATLFGRHDAVLAIGTFVGECGITLRCLSGDSLARSEQSLTKAGFDLLGFRSLDALSVWGMTDQCADQESIAAARASLGLAFAGILVGAMRAATEFALGYAEQRQSFGRPIIQHQLVAARLADIVIQFESSKLLLWQAASQPERVGLQMLAAHLRDASQHVFRDALQISGAHGYIDGLPTSKWLQTSAAICAWLCEFVGPQGQHPAGLGRLSQQIDQVLVTQE